MAKKKAAPGTPESPAGAPAPRTRRSPARKSSTADAAPVAVTGATQPAVTDTATDHSGLQPGRQGHTPSYEEIAEAAYLRFLQRGGRDGRDFDDWIEAEQELRRSRHGSSR